MTRPVLVALRALGLGDFLTGVPALRALGRAFPGHRLVLLAPRRLRPLAALAVPAFELVHHPGLVELPAELREPDIAVDLHGRGPGSQPLLLAARPRRLLAFAHPEIDGTAGGAVWLPGEHEVLRWCRMLEHHGVPADPLDLRLDLLGCVSAAPTVLHPGAASAARRWPLERYAAVGRRLLEAGHRLVLTGGGGEEALVAGLAAALRLGAGCCVVDAPLDRLARLVAGARLLVAGDTGVAHLATALGTPSVVLFGPVPPGEWGPLPGFGPHLALWAGRRGDPHGPAIDPGLEAIAVGDVLAAVERLERERARAGGGTGRLFAAASPRDVAAAAAVSVAAGGR